MCMHDSHHMHHNMHVNKLTLLTSCMESNALHRATKVVPVTAWYARSPIPLSHNVSSELYGHQPVWLPSSPIHEYRPKLAMMMFNHYHSLAMMIPDPSSISTSIDQIQQFNYNEPELKPNGPSLTLTIVISLIQTIVKPLFIDHGHSLTIIATIISRCQSRPSRNPTRLAHPPVQGLAIGNDNCRQTVWRREPTVDHRCQ